MPTIATDGSLWRDAVTDFQWPIAKARIVAFAWLAEELRITEGSTGIGDLSLAQRYAAEIVCSQVAPDLKDFLPHRPTLRAEIA